MCLNLCALSLVNGLFDRVDYWRVDVEPVDVGQLGYNYYMVSLNNSPCLVKIVTRVLLYFF